MIVDFGDVVAPNCLIRFLHPPNVRGSHCKRIVRGTAHLQDIERLKEHVTWLLMFRELLEHQPDKLTAKMRDLEGPINCKCQQPDLGICRCPEDLAENAI